VGLEIILGAKKIVVIATGSDKAAAINHLLQADHYNKD
jgi:6-phosphogluconolactonase/glucosamine-6-phosphate isomerase/deaminase